MVIAVVLPIALCLGLLVGAATVRFSRATQADWAAANQGEQLVRWVDTLNMLHARAYQLTPESFDSVSYAVYVSRRQAENVLSELIASRRAPALAASIKPLLQARANEIDVDLDALYVGSIDRSLPTSFQVLDANHAKLRDAASALASQLAEDAGRASRRFHQLAMIGFPLVSLGLGLIVLLRLRNRRRLHAQAALRERSAQFRAMVQSSHDVITVVDDRGCFVFVSPAAKHAIGRDAEELIGAPVTEVVSPTDADLFYRADQTIRTSGDATTVELCLRTSAGLRHFEATGTDGRPVSLAGTVWTWRDVHDRKALEHQLAHQAFHDSLTGLANRALFRDRAEQALLRAARSETPTTVLFFDLDGFKTINDSLGHGAGDYALVEAAERLRDSVRPGDTLARLGGDEFAVLLEAADPTVAQSIAQRIRHAIRQPMVVQHDGGTTEVSLSASVGIAVAGPTGEDVDALLRNADAAMYAAKAAGRDRVEQFEAQMYHQAVQRLELQGDLQKALSQRQMRVHYQPIIHLETGQVSGLEALLRWHHPTYGLIAPARFVPVAEESGLILEIGRWVIGEAVREAARHLHRGRPLRVNVNLSARQLLDPLVVDIVSAELHRHGLDPALLVLEITETVLLSSSEHVTERLRDLKTLGVRLSLDDFGTGYSSLSYLQRLPIDSVKIDRSFVSTTLDPGERGRVFVETIVGLGKSLHIETVAEGIESEHQLERLLEIGCPFGQGYLFSPAVPAEEVDTVIHGIHLHLIGPDLVDDVENVDDNADEVTVLLTSVDGDEAEDPFDSEELLNAAVLLHPSQLVHPMVHAEDRVDTTAHA